MILKNRISLKKIFSFLIIGLLNFCIYAQTTTTIKIDSAEKTEYKKSAETGDDEIILKGSVSLSVTKGSTTTTIKADSVTYNRATDMLYASGNITLKQTGSGAGDQNITADTLLFNTSTLEGIFDNGRVIQTQSDAINLPSGSTLIVASDIFGRDSSGTIDFKNAELTFCDAENPHWKIKASNIWLLPGGEFAFFNAVLTVGSLPLLYLPAFYYPKDELIFNPSFGYNKRKGYYFQTTTYLFGRKPLNTESSSSSDDDDITKGLFNFMKSSSLKEQVREGLVLHNLDKDYSGNTTNYLKVMGDYYSNLGFGVGLEGVYKPKKYISNLQGNLNFGFSNTLFQTGSDYVSYSPAGNIYYDHSNFMGFEMPFRYGADFQISMNKPFNLTLSIPMYSDPYFKDDFGDRSEYIDWIGFLMSSAKNDESTSTNTVSSFTWNANGSYTVSLPAAVKPYISSLAVSSVNSSIVFSSKNRTFTAEALGEKENAWKNYTPERMFYYPSQVTPVKASAKIAGTLVQISSKKTVSKASSNKVKIAVPLDVPEEFLTEEEKEKLAKQKEEEKLKKQQAENKTEETVSSETEEKNAQESESIESETNQQTALFELTESDLPLLSSNDSTSITSVSGINYSLTYSVTPALTSQISYNASALTAPEDFNWKEVYSTYYQIKVPATLNSKLSYRDSFASVSNSLSFNPVYQEHPYLSLKSDENVYGYTESAANAVKKTDYSAKKMDLTNTNTVSFKPFIYTSIFKNTSLDWNTSIKVIRTEFIGDTDNPEWDYKLAELSDDDAVTTHNLSATISAVEDKFSQVLTLTTRLPPQLDAYNATLKLTFPYVSLNFGTGVEQKSKDDTTFVLKPFQQSASVSLFNSKLTFTESFNYNLHFQKEEAYADSLKLSMSYKKIQLAYTMNYTNKYDFDENEGWVAREDKEFCANNLSFSYASGSTNFNFWHDRITFTPSVSTNVVYDFLRPTNSYFRFAPSLTFKIYDFLDLTFSSESRNSVIYRYIQKYTGHEGLMSGTTNPVVDLWNSFAFWDIQKRKDSGFKLKNLSVSLKHNLCDWDLSSTLTFKPRSVTGDNGKKTYSYDPYFSLSVSWRPMGSLKTEIVDEYGEWKLNP